MAVAQISQKAPGYDKAVTFWMRPAVHRALKKRAIHDDTTVQSLVERYVCVGMDREDLLPQPADSTN
jgi:hypothetical protein